MEFVLSITNKNQISKTSCQVINVGIEGYSFDNIYNVDMSELEELIREVKSYNKKLFISINRIFHEPDLGNVSNILSNLQIDDIDGIYFSDLGLVEIGKNNKVLYKMIYTPETLITNKYEVEALKDSNISSFSISNEITKEDILEIISVDDTKLDIIGFGYVSMFYSKRKLISLYNDSNSSITTDKEGYLIEEVRDGKYPILEGEYGTHIYRNKIFSVHNEIDSLKGIDYIRIESYKISSEVLEAAENALIRNDNSMLNEYFELIDDGFLNTKTMYKKVL